MATYYTSHNAGGGGVGSVGDPFTLQEGADNTTSADRCVVMDTGTYTPAATVDWDTNAGSMTAPVVFVGGDASGNEDGSVPVISGSSLGANTSLININVDHVIFTNLRFTVGTDHNISYGAAADNCALISCRSDGATDHGVYVSNSTQAVLMVDCEIDGNAVGVGSASSSRGKVIMVGCSVHDNTGAGLDLEPQAPYPSSISHSLIYDNGGAGVALNSSGSISVLIDHCTIFANDGDGIAATGGIGNVMIQDTILRSNGGYGLNVNSTIGQVVSLLRICSHNNTSGHTNLNGGTLWGSGHVLEDPAFVSEADGSENLRVTNTNLMYTFTPPSGGSSDQHWIGALNGHVAGGAGGPVRRVGGVLAQ